MNSWPSCPKDDQLGRRGPRSPSARSSYNWDSPKLGSKVQRREFYRGQGQQEELGRRAAPGGNLQGQLQGRPGFKVEGPSMRPAERR